MSRERRHFSREFKLTAVARFVESGNAAELARELGVEHAMLYKWHAKYAAGGAAALTRSGRPRKPSGEGKSHQDGGSRQRIAELERKIGQQQIELDFFRAALRQVGASRRGNGGHGGPGSTR